MRDGVTTSQDTHDGGDGDKDYDLTRLDRWVRLDELRRRLEEVWGRIDAEIRQGRALRAQLSFGWGKRRE